MNWGLRGLPLSAPADSARGSRSGGGGGGGGSPPAYQFYQARNTMYFGMVF